MSALLSTIARRRSSRALSTSPRLARSEATRSRPSVDSGSSSTSSIAMSSAGSRARARIASSTARRAIAGSRSSRASRLIVATARLGVAALRRHFRREELGDRGLPGRAASACLPARAPRARTPPRTVPPPVFARPFRHRSDLPPNVTRLLRPPIIELFGQPAVRGRQPGWTAPRAGSFAPVAYNRPATTSRPHAGTSRSRDDPPGSRRPASWASASATSWCASRAFAGPCRATSPRACAARASAASGGGASTCSSRSATATSSCTWACRAASRSSRPTAPRAATTTWTSSSGSGDIVRLNDPRRFGAMLWVRDPERHALLAGPGRGALRRGLLRRVPAPPRRAGGACR